MTTEQRIGKIDWVGRLRLWAEHPVELSSETHRALADELERLERENKRLHHERAEDVDRMERAAECIERLNAECNRLAGLRVDVGTALECTCREGLPRCAASVHRDQVTRPAPQ